MHDITKEFNTFAMMHGNWSEAVFRRFRGIIDTETDLSALDSDLKNAPSSSSAIASYSVHLTRLVRQRCSDVIEKWVNADLQLFGWALDMDGAAYLHFYVLVYMWKCISDGSRARSVRHIKKFEQDREAWRQFVVKSILADPRGQSEMMAERVMDSATQTLVKLTTKALSATAKSQLLDHAPLFTAAAVQSSLDERLPFNPAADSDEVVRYATDQANFISDEFEKRWKEHYQTLKARLVTEFRYEVRTALEKLLKHLENIRKFLKTGREAGSNLFSTSAQPGRTCFNVSSSDQQSATFAFFIDSCVGNNRQSDLYRDDTTWTWAENSNWEICSVHDLESWGSVPFVNMQTRHGVISSLEVFCDALAPRCLTKLREMETEGSLKLDITDLGLDSIYYKFKEDAIGCSACCPVCGRKCDRPEPGSATHRHACALGHQLRVMAGVTQGGMPSFQTCDEIQDDANIRDLRTRKWKTWRELKTEYPEWEFQYCEDASTKITNITKFRNCWQFHGKRICEHHTRSGKPITFSLLKPRDLHIVYVIDTDSNEKCNGLYHSICEMCNDHDMEEQYMSIIHADAKSTLQTVAPTRIKDWLCAVKNESASTIIAAMRGWDDERVDVSIVDFLIRHNSNYMRQRVHLRREPQLPNTEKVRLFEALYHPTLDRPDALLTTGVAYVTNDMREDPLAQFICERRGHDHFDFMREVDFRKYAKRVEEVGKKAAIVVADRLRAILQEEASANSLDWAWRVLSLDEGSSSPDVLDAAIDLTNALYRFCEREQPNSPAAADARAAIERVSEAKKRLLQCLR
ncbi:unnamed protein product [Amoebophrya sp. A25]|nr:unnamed protein product [Amoebophrya sp. A25]|eukprot:GSA25T00007347001.1